MMSVRLSSRSHLGPADIVTIVTTVTMPSFSVSGKGKGVVVARSRSCGSLAGNGSSRSSLPTPSSPNQLVGAYDIGFTHDLILGEVVVITVGKPRRYGFSCTNHPLEIAKGFTAVSRHMPHSVPEYCWTPSRMFRFRRNS